MRGGAVGRAGERERIASPGLSPTAIAMIDTAHSGRLSITRCPHVALTLDYISCAMVAGSLTDGRRPGVQIGVGSGVACRKRVTVTRLQRPDLRPHPRGYPAEAPSLAKQGPADNAGHEKHEQGAKHYAGYDN